jgi:N-acyl-D-aspartate/D-glutamate deacylase
MGVLKDVGTVEAGKWVDLVLLDARTCRLTSDYASSDAGAPKEAESAA